MKNKFNVTLRKILGSVLGFFGIGALTACYGVDEGRMREGHVVCGNVTNESGEMLSGIKVSTKDTNSSTTFTKNGYFSLSLPDSVKSCTVYFEDVDGEANGSYKKDSVEVDFNISDVFSENITLKKK